VQITKKITHTQILPSKDPPLKTLVVGLTHTNSKNFSIENVLSFNYTRIFLKGCYVLENT
jgi:hypothetical protein